MHLQRKNFIDPFASLQNDFADEAIAGIDFLQFFEKKDPLRLGHGLGFDLFVEVEKCLRASFFCSSVAVCCPDDRSK